jgi:ABC transporter related
MKVRIKFMSKEIKNENNILLKVLNIKKSYTQKKFLKKSVKIVLNDVSLSLEQGKCLGIIGESGSGKSTLGRIITGIEKADSGVVEFEGKNIHQKENRNMKNDISVVFQNYVSSVNPRFSVAQIIAEPLIISSQVNRSKIDKNKIDEEVKKLIKIVGLSEEFLERFPHELSGGQLQRVCIARAIVTKPKFILLDEAVSSLDVSTQVEILDLLQKLKKEYNLSYIFITHDLLTITYICDSVIFFKDGKIEEKIDDIRNLKNIKKDYSKKLLEAVIEF